MKLEAIGIGKQLPDKSWLFRSIDLSIRQGEIVGLQGASGSGKSSLCRILAGMDSPTEGEVRINGHLLPKRGYHPVQLVYQHPEHAVNPRWKVGAILNEGWQPDDELLDALHIDRSWFNRWPSELSGGQLQRICIARSLSPHTSYLLADEMTTMLDAITQAQIWKTALQIAEQRMMGMLVVSHDRALLHKVCDRVIDFHAWTV